MICEFPSTVKNRIVSCGRCAACRRRRADEWVCRVLCEQEALKIGGYGVTLTYNDKCLPANKSLDKKEISDYIKRLRDRLGYPDTFKYIAVGEYGSKRGRPHYHLLIFGIEINDENRKAIAESWTESKKGSFVKIKPIGHGRMVIPTVRYVCGYLLKSCGKYEMRPRESVVAYCARVGRESPQFFMCSNKLGLSYFEENKREIVASRTVRIFGLRFFVPRYFRKKIDEEFSVDELQEDLEKIRDDVVDRVGCSDFVDRFCSLDLECVAAQLSWWRYISNSFREFRAKVMREEFYRFREWYFDNRGSVWRRAAEAARGEDELEDGYRRVQYVIDSYVRAAELKKEEGKNVTPKQILNIEARYFWRSSKKISFYEVFRRYYESQDDYIREYIDWFVDDIDYCNGKVRFCAPHMRELYQWNCFMQEYQQIMLVENVQKAVNYRDKAKLGRIW